MRRLAYIKQDKLSFSYHLADHCNLNCKGCDNYSSVAREAFTDIDVFKRDMKRIKQLFGNDVPSILLLGGEPLLNPNIEKYFEVARTIFPEPNTEIAVVTNGILLSKMGGSFWKSCRDNNIKVTYTRYPIKIGLEEIGDTAKSYGVIFERYGRPDDGEKTLQFDPFDLRGCQDIETNFRNCFHANKCIQLSDGKLYTCNIRAYAHIFCDYFDVKMELSEKDYIDIYSETTKDEILKFLSEPIPFCRYCRIIDRSDGHIWRTSNKEPSIYDWLWLQFDERAHQELSQYEKVVFLFANGLDENYIWNTGFEKEENYSCFFISDMDSLKFTNSGSVLQKQNTAVVIVSDDIQELVETEKAMYLLGFCHLYLAKYDKV